MNAAVESLNPYATTQAAAHLPGDAPWLVQWRRDALADFVARGFPSARDERWKYTRTTPIERVSWRLAQERTGASDGRVAAHLLNDVAVPRLVFVDGVFDAAWSSVSAAAAGVELHSLADMLNQQADVGAALQGRAVEEGNPFVALNSAFLGEGAYVRIAADAASGAPIHLLFVATSAQQGAMAHPRIIVDAGVNSRTTIITQFIGLDAVSYFNNAVFDISVGAGAQLEHYVLQQESDAAFHIASHRVRLDRDAHYAAQGFSLGGALARHDITATLEGAGADCQLQGLYLVNGRQHVDHQIQVDHAQPHGTSSQLFKGVLDGRARGVFSGKVIVRPGAQQTDARQTNNNLLLSEDAEADARPQLEIYADDVKCSHGATVGQLDRDAVFYLRSRGIDEASARAMLTFAFAAELLDSVKSAEVRARLRDSIIARLPQGSSIEGTS